jgi:hypothetical protein
MADARLQKFRKIIANAIGSLSQRRRRSTNLYLDTRAYRGAMLVGPPVQKITTRGPCLIVFVDDEPRANFAHRCRYRFYDVRSQRFLYETHAEFPPYVDWIPRTYVAIYEPIRPVTRDEEPQRGQ